IAEDHAQRVLWIAGDGARDEAVVDVIEEGDVLLVVLEQRVGIGPLPVVGGEVAIAKILDADAAGVDHATDDLSGGQIDLPEAVGEGVAELLERCTEMRAAQTEQMLEVVDP